MFLVLTYHRVVEGAAGISDFFDVTSAELSRHVELAKECWGACLDPAALMRTDCAKGKRGFVITFDDGTVDHLRVAAPVLERHGVRGVFFVSTALIGQPGYMTTEECVELQSRGHWIENHSHDHLQLASLTRSEVEQQLAEAGRQLDGRGIGKCKFLAVPGGYSSDEVIAAAKATGVRLLRTLVWGYNLRFDPYRIESITINRQTSGRAFGFMVSPRHQWLKSLFFKVKETLKDGQLRKIYFLLRR